MIANSFVVKVGKDLQSHTIRDQVCRFKDVVLIAKDLNSRHIRLDITDDGFVLFFGEASSPNETVNFQAAGTILLYSESTRTLTVETDRLGTGLLYWCYLGDTISFSNRLENLVNKQPDPDWSSIQQYLHTGFTIKDKTFFKEIYQTEPNSKLQAQLTESTVNLSVSERDSLSVGSSERPEVLTELISEELSRLLKTAAPSVLMMSAGWDSRTLLIEKKARLVGAYTHGDLSSREIDLARKLTGKQRLDHLFTDVESCSISTSLIDQMLSEVGFGVFPIWFLAAQNVSKWKDVPIMSGVLGELLGGHYGLMSWGTRGEKLLSSMLLINESLITDQRIRSVIERYSTPPNTHWFVSPVGQELLDENRFETKRRSLEAIDECYEATGNWQRALEDFNMSHRARQYILKQAQAASSTIGYTIPFANDHLTDLIRELDFNNRIHNKSNRQMLKKKRPDLLSEPMAATLIAAKYPILLQEVSRIVRVLGEKSTQVLGKQPKRRGWFNYEHLYEDEILHHLTDSLKSDVWDKNSMHTVLRENPINNIDAGSTLDMLCKLKTIDYYLSIAAGKQDHSNANNHP